MEEGEKEGERDAQRKVLTCSFISAMPASTLTCEGACRGRQANEPPLRSHHECSSFTQACACKNMHTRTTSDVTQHSQGDKNEVRNMTLVFQLACAPIFWLRKDVTRLIAGHLSPGGNPSACASARAPGVCRQLIFGLLALPSRSLSQQHKS